MDFHFKILFEDNWNRESPLIARDSPPELSQRGLLVSDILVFFYERDKGHLGIFFHSATSRGYFMGYLLYFPSHLHLLTTRIATIQLVAPCFCFLYIFFVLCITGLRLLPCFLEVNSSRGGVCLCVLSY